MQRTTPFLAVIFCGAACCVYADGPAAPAAAAQGNAQDTSSAVKHFTTPAGIKTIACSADGKLIATVSNPPMILQGDGTYKVKDDWKPSVDILDAASGKSVVSIKIVSDGEDVVLVPIRRISYFEVTALAFSPDANVVAVGTSVGQVKLFNARTGELVKSLDDEQAKLADHKTPEQWKAVRRAMGGVSLLVFSPDGSQLATCGNSFSDFARVFEEPNGGGLSTEPGRLKIWDIKSGTIKHDLVAYTHAYAVAFSPDGSLLASGGGWRNETEWGTGAILWNAQTGEKLRTIKVETYSKVDSVHSIAFSPDGKLIAISSLHLDFAPSKPEDANRGAISLVNVASGEVQWRKTFTGIAKPVAFLPNESSVIALNGGGLWFRNERTGQVQMELNPGEPQGRAGKWNDLAVAKQGHMQVMAGQDADQKGAIDILDPDRPQAAEPLPANDGKH